MLSLERCFAPEVSSLTRYHVRPGLLGFGKVMLSLENCIAPEVSSLTHSQCKFRLSGSPWMQQRQGTYSASAFLLKQDASYG